MKYDTTNEGESGNEIYRKWEGTVEGPKRTLALPHHRWYFQGTFVEGL